MGSEMCIRDRLSALISRTERNEDGFVSALSFLKDSDIIKLHIKMQYDIEKNGYYVTDVFSSDPEDPGTPEDIIIEQGGKLINTNDY